MDTEELQKLLDEATPGPWGISHEEKWPFDITIGDGIVSMTRIAYSTCQNSLADVRAAVGFDWRERDNVAAMVAQQEADARLIALAPTIARKVIAAEKLVEAVRRVSFSDNGIELFSALAAWEAAQ